MRKFLLSFLSSIVIGIGLIAYLQGPSIFISKLMDGLQINQVDAAISQGSCWSSSLTCTANEVNTIIPSTTIIEGCDGNPSDTTTIQLSITLTTNASKRYDIGGWIATNGSSVLGGDSCIATSLTAPASSNDDGDSCGDVVAGTYTFNFGQVTVACNDPDGDYKLNLPFCAGWDQNAGNVCSGPLDTVPGSPAKCECAKGGLTVNVPVPPEVCDGTDNNGTGGIDELFPDTDNDGLKDCIDICPNDAGLTTNSGAIATYGDVCSSSANNCGTTNDGTIQCNGSCSATTPVDISDTIVTCNNGLLGSCFASGSITTHCGIAGACTAPILTGTTEICDNIDNDCDGQVDEDIAPVVTNCSAGLGACFATGTQTSVCTEGTMMTGSCTAVASTPSTESCDSIDNDCDGQVDEDIAPVVTNCSAGLGACFATGTQTSVCTEGIMTMGMCTSAAGEPIGEICDSIDNDCDGQVDEDIAPVVTNCSAGLGACFATGTQTSICTEGIMMTGSCTAIASTPSAESCDSIDNDCDGQVDEDIAPVVTNCSTGLGACFATGTQTSVCTEGTMMTGSCTAIASTPSTESCDSIDNDCDGQVDEDIAPVVTNCSAGLGACFATGTQTSICSSGSMMTGSCTAIASTPSAESCDSVDNDCDGLVDESVCGGGGTTTGTPTPTIDLYTNKVVNHSSVVVGSTLTYTISYGNNGNSEATNVIIKDVLPNGLQFISSSVGSYTSGVVSLEIASLGAGSAGTISITVSTVGSSAGNVINNANITGSGSETNTTNNSSQATTLIVSPSTSGGGQVPETTTTSSTSGGGTTSNTTTTPNTTPTQEVVKPTNTLELPNTEILPTELLETGPQPTTTTSLPRKLPRTGGGNILFYLIDIIMSLFH